MMEGKLNEAGLYFQQACELYRNTNDEYSLAFCLSQQALILRHQSNRDIAEKLLFEVIKLSKKLNLKRKDTKNWFVKSYFLNLLTIFNAGAEARELKYKLEQQWNSSE
jgi:hypothetical protein